MYSKTMDFAHAATYVALVCAWRSPRQALVPGFDDAWLEKFDKMRCTAGDFFGHGHDHPILNRLSDSASGLSRVCRGVILR